jgi:hypothetical protein
MGLIQNLKIDLACCVYKISIIVLKMENEWNIFYASWKAMVKTNKGSS